MYQITLGGLSPLVSNEWEEGVVVEQRLADLNFSHQLCFFYGSQSPLPRFL